MSKKKSPPQQQKHTSASNASSSSSFAAAFNKAYTYVMWPRFDSAKKKTTKTTEKPRHETQLLLPQHPEKGRTDHLIIVRFHCFFSGGKMHRRTMGRGCLGSSFCSCWSFCFSSGIFSYTVHCIACTNRLTKTKNS